MIIHDVHLETGVLFNPDNVLETVKGVEDWWSEGDRLCRRGGLGYWLAISLEIRRQLQDKYADPDVQKVKLIECWMEHDFASWQWLRRAVQRVGHSYLASLITSYQQHTHTGIQFPANSLHVENCASCTTRWVHSRLPHYIGVGPISCDL